MKTMYPELKNYCRELTGEFDQIPAERKTQLEALSEYIIEKQSSGDSINLNFICTHNSRRSHFGQLWGQTAAYWYGIDKVKTFSGGTESTAFNKRSVAALVRAGFNIENKGKGKEENPRYLARQGDDYEWNSMFSKKFDHSLNPKENFAAVMVCSDADENCPFVPGAEKRFAITYEDPKAFDNTDQEMEKYDERCRQIGREMFYVFDIVSNRKEK